MGFADYDASVACGDSSFAKGAFQGSEPLTLGSFRKGAGSRSETEDLTRPISFLFGPGPARHRDLRGLEGPTKPGQNVQRNSTKSP